MIFKTKYSKAVLFNFAALMVVHTIAFWSDLYYIVKDFDTFMHLWGGVSIALFFVWFFYYSDFFKESAPKNWLFFLFLIVGCSALIGIGWEFYEYIGNNYIAMSKGQMQGDVTDTMGDLLIDLLGGLVVGVYFLPKIGNKQNG